MIIEELVANHLYFLEQKASEDEDYYEALIAIKVFKALFMEKKLFKKDDLDNKTAYMNIVLKLLLHQNLKDEEQIMINDDISKYQLFDQIARDNDLDYYYPYCFYLIFHYSDSKIFFIDVFISYMKKSFKDENDIDLEIRKDESISEEQLKKIKEKDLLIELGNIYYAEENYYILYIDNDFHKLKKKKMSPEETREKINEKKEPEVVNELIKKIKKNDKIKKFENQSEQDKIQNKNTDDVKDKNEVKNEENSNSKNNNEIKELKPQNIEEIKNCESQKYEEYGEKKEKFENLLKGETLQEKYERLSFQMDELKELINNLTEADAKKSKKINELQEKMDKLKLENYEMKIEIKRQKKKHAEYKTIIRNTKNDFVNINKDSIEAKNVLKLVQLRDVFKNIIDLFCKVYGISTDETYIDKIFKIQAKIKSQIMKEDENLQLIKFFDKIDFDQQFSNIKAHITDLSEPIINQLFTFIDPKNEWEKVRTKLSKGNIENLLKKYALNRINNFNNIDKIKEEEKIINSINKIIF